MQNARDFAELRNSSTDSVEEKKTVQDKYYLTHGMFAAPDASMSLTQLRQAAADFCEWTIHEGHALHAKTPFMETTANFLLKAGLALDGTTVRGLGIAPDPGFKLELLQNGYYPPHVGPLQIPPHSVRRALSS